MAELDAMLRMLYASREADPDLLQLLAINGSGDEDTLTFDEFSQVCGSFCIYREARGFLFTPRREYPSITPYFLIARLAHEARRC